MAAFDVRSLDVPIVQAGMGGVARHEVAAAVSEAGGLERAAKIQRPAQPFLGPQPPTIGRPDNLVDPGPLYAGANVGRIEGIRPAAELVRTLAP